MPSDPEPVEQRAGNSSRLSRDLIVNTALAMIDEDGIGAVSMRSLAGRLGVEAMSLYKHIANRDKLLDAIVDRIVGELAHDPDVPQQLTGQDWPTYLTGVARGIRRYARHHPHAFPIVATRPTDAPWINPPLRSLDWIEHFLTSLRHAGFTDQQILFAYRSFNGFLLGFLLLETSAMTIHDPAPGDGAYTPDPAGNSSEPANSADPVPGALTPTRRADERHDLAAADTPAQILNPQGTLDPQRYPTIHDLAAGLAEDHFNTEFEHGLQALLQQIRSHIAA